MPHRISAPSARAPGPRYSLVWKLVFVPRGTPGGGGREPGREASVEAVAAAAAEEARLSHTSEGLGRPVGGLLQSVCRPEWGAPLRVGSASRHAGGPVRPGCQLS
jgi:hypothetical protein